MSTTLDQPTSIASTFADVDDTYQIPKLDLPKTVDPKRLLWIYAIPIALVHLASLLAFVPYFFSWTSVIIMLVSIEIYGLGI